MFTATRVSSAFCTSREGTLCVYSSQKCGCGAGLFVCSQCLSTCTYQTYKCMYSWLMMLCELCEFKMYKNALVQLCKIIELVVYVCVCAVSCFPLWQWERRASARFPPMWCKALLAACTSCQLGEFLLLEWNWKILLHSFLQHVQIRRWYKC